MLHGRRVRGGVPEARGGASQDAALYPQDQWHGGALQRTHSIRGARDHGCQPWRSRDPAGGFNQAYNARRQRVLRGRSPEMVVHERLSAAPELINPRYMPPNDPFVLPNALKVAARAKDVSRPDNYPLVPTQEGLAAAERIGV